ncbi:MAG: hypothetical protein GY940_22045 [bacterium]|nr:hypothetical protein [bacterium]
MQNYLNEKIKEDTHHIQRQQQPRIDKKIHNMRVELMDAEEYMKKEEQDILADLGEIDKKINSTFDVEAGKKLLEQKRKRQKDLKRCRKELLEFQNKFQDTFDEDVLNLMEKRFIKDSHEKIFSFDFHIR